MTYKEGDKVIINPDSVWCKQHKQGCDGNIRLIGTVNKNHSNISNLPIIVQWDNSKAIYSYDEKDLIPYGFNTYLKKL